MRGPKMTRRLEDRQLVIITDLDGTLLDQRTYRYDASLPALRRLQADHVPIVLCSTKTSAEVLQLWRELGLHDPFICESGGAIYMPQDYLRGPLAGLVMAGPFGVLALGMDVLRLRAALAAGARDCQASIRSFGQMHVEEIAALTGLEPDQAFRAWQRQYDEPFLVESGDAEKLSAWLRGRGLTVSRGDRFYHVTGGHSKRDAVIQLMDVHRRWYGETYTVGLGNSANDWPMLSAVDRPVLVRNPDGQWDAEVMRRVPKVECTTCAGPEGWREAVDKIVEEAGR